MPRAPQSDSNALNGPMAPNTFLPLKVRQRGCEGLQFLAQLQMLADALQNAAPLMVGWGLVV